MKNVKFFSLVTFSMMLLFSTCSPNLLVTWPQLDTPPHHVKTGFKFMEMGKLNDATREFKRAVVLDSRYAPAHIGLGLIFAHQGDFEKGVASIQTAEQHTVGKEQQVAVYTGYMRLYTILKTQAATNGWLARVTDAFHKARGIDPKSPEPFLYLGIAYKTAGEYDQALAQFVKVFEMDSGLVEAADREYTQVRRLMKTGSQ